MFLYNYVDLCIKKVHAQSFNRNEMMSEKWCDSDSLITSLNLYQKLLKSV